MLFAAHGYHPGKKKYRKKMLLQKHKCYLRHTGTIRGKINPGTPLVFENAQMLFAAHAGGVGQDDGAMSLGYFFLRPRD